MIEKQKIPVVAAIRNFHKFPVAIWGAGGAAPLLFRFGAWLSSVSVPLDRHRNVRKTPQQQKEKAGV